MKDETILILAGGAVLVLWYTGYKAKQTAASAAKTVGAAINPVSHDNIFNRGVNAVGAAISGDEHWTLGTQIYKWLHE